MKKLLVSVLLCAGLAIQLSAQDAPKPASVPIEQYERAVPILLKQRAEADASARDWQLQAAMLAAEVEKLKQQIADLSAKLAAVDKPKSESKTASTDTKSQSPKS